MGTKCIHLPCRSGEESEQDDYACCCQEEAFAALAEAEFPMMGHHGERYQTCYFQEELPALAEEDAPPSRPDLERSLVET